jgi:hypothetical protein
MPESYGRFAFVIACTLFGGVFDTGVSRLFERATGALVPQFNLAFTWGIRCALAFGLIGWLATWCAAVGRQTSSQRALFWILLPVVPLVGPVVPLIGKVAPALSQGMQVIGPLIAVLIPSCNGRA